MNNVWIVNCKYYKVQLKPMSYEPISVTKTPLYLKQYLNAQKCPMKIAYYAETLEVNANCSLY